MKQVRLVIHEPAINKIIGSELNLLLDDKANLVDACMHACEKFSKALKGAEN